MFQSVRLKASQANGLKVACLGVMPRAFISASTASSDSRLPLGDPFSDPFSDTSVDR